MIAGLGIDLVEIRRIELAMKNPRFVRRILTERERAFVHDAKRVAGRWAAKEAIAKALDIRLRWSDVEIFNDESRMPVVVLSNWFRREHQRVHVSISHERGMAVAVAIVERFEA